MRSMFLPANSTPSPPQQSAAARWAACCVSTWHEPSCPLNWRAPAAS